MPEVLKLGLIDTLPSKSCAVLRWLFKVAGVLPLGGSCISPTARIWCEHRSALGLAPIDYRWRLRNADRLGWVYSLSTQQPI